MKNVIAKHSSRIFVVFTILFITLLLSAKVNAASVGDFTVTGSSSDYSFADNTLTITGSGELTISGTSTTQNIAVADGITANVTLDGVNIDNSLMNNYNKSPFEIIGAGTANITLFGENVLIADQYYAGISVTENATLIITESSTGTLQAVGGSEAAGIGGIQVNPNAGSITINGGTINATATNVASGIGSGDDGAGGNITINGGDVTATGESSPGIGGGYFSGYGNITINGGTIHSTGGNLAAGIGGDRYCTGGTIKITGGNITAIGGAYAAAIGGGSNGSGGTITISGGVVNASADQLYALSIGGGDGGAVGTFSTGDNGTAWIYASKPISDQSRKASWSGFIYENIATVTVGGAQTLNENLTVNLGANWTLLSGAVLTVPNGLTLDIDGTINVNGTIDVYGRMINDGTVQNNNVVNIYNNIQNNGSFLGNPYLNYNQRSGDLLVFGGLIDVDYGYDSDSRTLTIIKETPVTISGTTTQDKVVVQGGVSANLTFNELNIDLSSANGEAAFEVESGGAVAVTVLNDNSLKSGNGRAGLEVPNGATLVITASSSGSLDVDGGEGGAGIGGGQNEAGGDITISSGTIVATTIGDGNGVGSESSSSSFSTGDGNAWIVSENGMISDQSGKASWSGIIFEDGDGAVYKNQTLAQNRVIPTGANLTVPANTRLTIPTNTTLTNNDGTLSMHGWIEGDGRLEGDGNYVASILLTENIQNIPTQNYTGSSIEPTIYATGTRTFSGAVFNGKVFNASLEGYEFEYRNNVNVGTNTASVIITKKDEIWDLRLVETFSIESLTENFIVVGGEYNDDYSVTEYSTYSVITVLTDTPLEIYNVNKSKSTADRIVVADGVMADITLSGVHIDVSGMPNATAFHTLGTANITLVGDNILKSGNNKAGFAVIGDAAVTFTANSTGTLNVTGGAFGSGIGGNLGYGDGHTGQGDAGTITINGGTINATSGSQAAAIGGGHGGKRGNITIAGGVVTTSLDSPNEYGAIGGWIHATNDNGTFSTGSNGDAWINTQSGVISDQTSKEDWSGVIIEDGNTTFYGDRELNKNYTTPAGKTMSVPNASKLTIPADITLTNNGDFTVAGTLTVLGTLTGSGTLGGDGEFISNQLSQDNIDSIQDVTHTGGEIKPAINLIGTIEIMNTQFTPTYEGWLISYEDNIAVGSGKAVLTKDGQRLEKAFEILSASSSFTVSGGTKGDDYTLTDTVLTVLTDTPLTLSSDGETSIRIVIESDHANLTLNNLKINVSEYPGASAISVGSGKGLLIHLLGTNSLYSGLGGAGIHVPKDSILTIMGNNTGELTVTGRAGGAAIGGVKGGVVSDSGVSDGVGDAGYIAIEGGVINAVTEPEGLYNIAATIGGGYAGAGGSVTITDGTVTISSERSYGAIGGWEGEGAGIGTFSTGISGNAWIYAKNGAILDKSSRDRWSGVIIENGEMEMYGDTVTLSSDAEINSGQTLTIAEHQTLDISKVTLTNNGTLYRNGTLNGSLSGTPFMGDLNGDGTLSTADLTAVLETDNYNKTVAGGASELADLNGDGKVNFADLAIARNSKNFGR